MPVYLVEQPTTTTATSCIKSAGKDYNDNCERFVFFSRAVLEAVRLLDLEVDVLHCQRLADRAGAGLSEDRISRRAAVRADGIAVDDPQHGLPGQFWHWDMLLTGSIGSISTGSRWSSSAS